MLKPKVHEVKIKSYAKVNLALDVLGTREDGYHLLETVMQKVQLADSIQMRWEEAGCVEADGSSLEEMKIIVSTNKPYLPTDERNLAYKAARIMAETAGKQGRLFIHIEKRIPVAAGLGGGSSNAASVMIALNRLWKMRLSTRRLCEMSKALGADIPFLVLVQNTAYECALGSGTGDELRALKKGMRKYLVLAKPAFGVSTKEVFRGIDDCTITQRPNISELVRALKTGEQEKVLSNMINVLEVYTCSRYKEVNTLKEKMKATDGVRKVIMSGSGPTVMAVYDTYGAAKKACLAIRTQGYEAYWTQTMKEIGGKKNAEF